MSVLLLRPSNNTSAEELATTPQHVTTTASSKDQTATNSSALQGDITRTTGKYSQRRSRDANYENVVYTENAYRPGHRLLASIGGSPRKIRKPSVSESERSASISSSMDSVDAYFRAEESNRYNRLKLSTRSNLPHTGVLSYKPRRIQQRMNMTDSESSSSLTDSPENCDKKVRETQHYNRLKLNLNRLPNNKKALKGFQILYKDSPREATMMQSLPTPAKTRRRLQRSTSSDPSLVVQESTQKLPTSRYHNESHGNKLHAVSGMTMRKSTSFVASNHAVPRSHSSGDIAKYSLSQASESTDSAGTHSRRNYKSRSQSFSDMASTNVVLRSRKSQPSQSYEPSRSMEKPIESNLASGQLEADQHIKRINGESDHYRSRASSESHRPNQTWHSSREDEVRSKSFSNLQMSASQSSLIEKPRPLTPLSSLATDTCPTTASTLVDFMDPIITIPFDTNGGEYHSAAHGFRIVVPKGAIKKRTSVEIQFGVTMHGPFEFPSNKKPVSPILWVSAKPESKFRKPIEITIPHFLDMSNGTGDRYSKKINKGMSFLKASDKTATPFQRGKSTQLYQFKVASESEECFWPNESHGTISAKHLGFFCIAAAKNNPELKPRYCIIPVIPKLIQKSSWKIHYCVTYLLKTSIQVVKKQFGEGWEVLPPRRFKFLEDGREEKIGIQFQRAIPGTGWILALESESKVRAADVDMWNREDGEVGVMESMKIYPKRFTIRVHGEDATCASVTQVSFIGAAQDISTEIVLPLRAVRGRESLIASSCDPTSPLTSSNRTSLQRPCSSVSSSQHCETCPCEVCGAGGGEEEEEEGGDYDHLPTMENLDQIHLQLTYHNGHIDMPTAEDLQQVAAEVTKAIQEDWPALQAPLDVPDHIMLDVLHQRTILQQVYRLLKEWKKYTVDCSKGKLAQCLRLTDARLQPVAEMLLASK